ncbi:hypothetical protein CR513_43121, partial [Mucuna pruriens]
MVRDDRNITEQKALQATLDLAEAQARHESLMDELAHREAHASKAHEEGFNKALRQISVLIPSFDSSPMSIHKDILVLPLCHYLLWITFYSNHDAMLRDRRHDSTGVQLPPLHFPSINRISPIVSNGPTRHSIPANEIPSQKFDYDIFGYIGI